MLATSSGELKEEPAEEDEFGCVSSPPISPSKLASSCVRKDEEMCQENLKLIQKTKDAEILFGDDLRTYLKEGSPSQIAKPTTPVKYEHLPNPPENH